MGTIYFIEAVGTGFVKIGYTNQKCSDRLFALQGANPFELKLLAAFDGMQRFEFVVHKRFAHLRVRREWFLLDDELRAFIESVPLSNLEWHAPLATEAPADITAIEAWKDRLEAHQGGC